jgi:ubiquinone/menaquinone biosynthesis C-methylase UbiE
MLRGKVQKVIGSDIDPVVRENPSIDEALVTVELDSLPLDESSVDLIVSDYVLEHIADPQALSAEFLRVLKKGGWVCCRTPNKFGYVSVATRLISNRFHRRVLQRAQSHRKSEDVFPTLFRLNSMRAIRRAFPREQWIDCSYYYEAEPAYHFGSRFIGRLMRLVNKLLPRKLSGNLFVFLKKR